MLYERSIKNGEEQLRYTEEKYELAGYNILYKLWKDKGSPINEGWHVSEDEMIKKRTEGKHSINDRRLLVDAAPNAKDWLEIIVIQDIWAYTFGEENSNKTEDNIVYWTPLMIGGKHVFREDYDKSPKEREQKIQNISRPNYQGDWREFLYLKGNQKGVKSPWTWGPSGRTNAAFLDPEAREYFRQYF